MINFRYHVVSLMAVFLALSVGIVLGVTLISQPATETLIKQADADRRELQQTREQLTRQNALNTYRDAWAERVGGELTAGALNGDQVAVVAMPDAPARVVSSISEAITTAGGTIVADVEIGRNAYDPDRATETAEVVDPLAAELELDPGASTASKFGAVLREALLDPTGEPPGDRAKELLTGLTDGRLVSTADDVTERATLVVVVTAAAPASSDPTAANQTLGHAQTELALKAAGLGVVVAGPNSDNVAGTDVQQIRTPGATADQLSTVDVADLPSGVVTTVLALREQSLDGQGHYGATGDAVAPELPIR